MRIISGVAKGRRLIAPSTATTRPVLDRVREAIFSMIGDWVAESRVLDLYAGSGSFGLEALSRGAESAVFVENGRLAVQALRSNIESLGLGGVIVTSPVSDFLAGAGHDFDLVFIDPPWDLPSVGLAGDLSALDRRLSAKGEVVTSRRFADESPSHPENWRVATDRRYGDTRILRYEKETDAS